MFVIIHVGAMVGMVNVPVHSAVRKAFARISRRREDARCSPEFSDVRQRGWRDREARRYYARARARVRAV